MDQNSSKVRTSQNIPTKCLKVTSDICSPFLAAICNQEFFLIEKFKQKLKLHKKEDSTEVKNNRPVSVLPTVSHIFERLMQEQRSEYANHFFPPFLCDSRKGFSTQTALV